MLKDAIDRPRPAGGLVDFGRRVVPQRPCRLFDLYVWLAMTLVLRLRPGMARRTAVCSPGIALAAAIGLSRVYLDVHYMSDVSGGWALGASAFALCAAVACSSPSCARIPPR